MPCIPLDVYLAGAESPGLSDFNGPIGQIRILGLADCVAEANHPLFLRKNGDFFTSTTKAKTLTSGAWIPTLKSMATLPNNISSLSAAEKFELLDALWEDLEAHSASLSAEQAEELDQRIAAYEKNPPTGTPWEQVKAGLPKR